MTDSTNPDHRSAQSGEIVVRRAELRDIRHVRKIDLESFPSPWSEETTVIQVTGDQRVHFVAEKDFRIVGHAGLVFLAGVAHVATFAVTESSRGTGVGDALMKRLFEAATANGCDDLTLEVRASNAPAIRLYKRHGLEAAGMRKGYYQDDGEDAVVMTGTQRLY